MIRFGIIGGGGISDTHARAVSEVENAQVVAFYGANADKVTQLSSRYGGACYTSFDEFLNHKPMDAVSSVVLPGFMLRRNRLRRTWAARTSRETD
jgi:predicted dehydrogenase